MATIKVPDMTARSSAALNATNDFFYLSTATTDERLNAGLLRDYAMAGIVGGTGIGISAVDPSTNTVTISSTGGSGTGDVVGPSSSTDNSVARFDSTTGKLIQDTGANFVVSDAGAVTAGSWTGTAIAVANGGSGQTTYTNGQLLIGNTTGNTLTKAALSAGSNVTITNGTGSISIAATDTNTEYTAGDGLNLAGTVFSTDLVSNGGLEIQTAELSVSQGISQYDVAQFAASVVDDDFLRVDGTAVEGRSASEVKSDIGLSNVENTALSTWVGTTNITTLGTIATGTWNGTDIAAGNIADTAVTPGSYTLASITVDQQGRLTSASTGSSGAGDVAGPGSSTDNSVARFDSTTGKVIQDTGANFVISDAGAVTAGSWTGTTIAVDQGGSGQTSYTNGQLLIGNTTSNTLTKAALTGGSNVTVTNGTGTISIAATDTNTTYTAGDGLGLSGTVFSTDLKANGGLVIESAELAVDLGASSITGTLANADLANSSVSYGGISVALGASDATPAFDLADATNYEGTAVLSTSETGTTKFLRVDGDNSSSWQVPPDTNTTYSAGDGLSLSTTTFAVDFTRDNAWTGSQRGTPSTITNGTIDLDTANNFLYTPAGADDLEFSNETTGQSGFIWLDNSSGHAISPQGEVKKSATFTSDISAAGKYLISYFSDGTDVWVSASAALS